MASTIGMVIPAHNAEWFLDQALASVAWQSRPVQQVVLVDDGSTDGTAERASRWTDVLPLRVVRSPRRGGIGHARRLGIEHLDTDLVLQLDADDLLLPHHVRAMAQAHERHPGLISPRPLLWDGAGDWRAATYYKNRLPAPGDQLAQLLLLNYVVVGAMFDRRRYQEVGGYRGCAFSEDWDLWLRLVAAGERVTKLETATYVYRRHPGSFSVGVNRQHVQTVVLENFLADCAEGRYRRIAKLSMLQRLGARYLDRLPPVRAPEQVLAVLGVAADRLAAVGHDPELGLVLHEAAADRVSVVDLGPAEELRLVLHGRELPDGFQVDYVHDESLRLRWSSLLEAAS
ncbi:glycosyltransferase [Crossiella sp. CA-258035]|uniref:glycosyltransferase family 2 protein n=1 Tax=Crossiella sp. CA-258035 TaxID=2981138 RepID=UPI0024BCE19A|nr:glycosyltransferase [Crossiella sp. CA-258035]WHT15788.1 glycosyltransferase [Crossiella sp. CA-258035]